MEQTEIKDTYVPLYAGQAGARCIQAKNERWRLEIENEHEKENRCIEGRRVKLETENERWEKEHMSWEWHKWIHQQISR